MLDRVGEWATALTGVVSLPVWAVVGIGAVLVLACALALVRAGGEGRSVPVVVLVLIVALAGWWARDHFARRDLEAEQRALDTRAFELATRAFMPGSALGCLDAIAGETVEEACEKAVFASPEATAAAVSYVAAQLSLLASARPRRLRAGSVQRLRLAARHQPHQRQSRGTPVRSSAQDLRRELAGRRQSGRGEHSAVAGTQRGGQSAEQPLLPVSEVDPAGQYHDRGTTAGATAAPRHNGRGRGRDADAATPAAAGGCAAASAGERRTRAFGADAACSRAITAPIF